MIRNATAQDVVRIVASRGDKADPATVRFDQCVICELPNGAEMMFHMARFDDAAEVHIYCAPRHIRHLRTMVAEFFDVCRGYGIYALVTETDKQPRMDSFVEKLGFVRVCEYNDINVYRKDLA